LPPQVAPPPGQVALQLPPVHLPVQQSAPLPQLAPGDAQGAEQRPLSHVPLQQSALLLQVAPLPPQAQSLQTPPQPSAPHVTPLQSGTQAATHICLTGSQVSVSAQHCEPQTLSQPASMLPPGALLLQLQRSRPTSTANGWGEFEAAGKTQARSLIVPPCVGATGLDVATRKPSHPDHDSRSRTLSRALRPFRRIRPCPRSVARPPQPKLRWLAFGCIRVIAKDLNILALTAFGIPGLYMNAHRETS
jgi:hypothetical protein